VGDPGRPREGARARITWLANTGVCTLPPGALERTAGNERHVGARRAAEDWRQVLLERHRSGGGRTARHRT